jgi:folate-binding protein YgfZ
VPLHYGDGAAESLRVRRIGGIIDRSFLGKLLLTGNDRVKFLQGMVTNNVNLVTAEKGLYSLIVTVKGKIVADFALYGLEEGMLMVLQPELTTVVQQLLDRYIITSQVQIEDVSGQWGILSLQGPQSAQLLEKVFGKPLAEREEYTVDLLSYYNRGPVRSAPMPPDPSLGPAPAEPDPRLSDQTIRVVHRYELGERGFDLLVPRDRIEPLWEVLLKEGEGMEIAPFGLQAFETLRIEAGTPRYGYEMDENIFPLEADVEHAVSYDKGCYIGQETVTRMKFRGHANRHRVGLEIQGGTPPSKGDRLEREGVYAGLITSAIFSPSLKRVLGMGYVRRELATPGTELVVKLASGETIATVSKLPFVGQTRPSVS